MQHIASSYNTYNAQQHSQHMSVHIMQHEYTDNNVLMLSVAIYTIEYKVELTLLANVAMKYTSIIVATPLNEQCKYCTVNALQHWLQL